MLRRSILGLLWTALAAMGQPSGTAVIAGSVVDGLSGDPVAKAVVTVTWHGTPRSWATARTDGSGHFRFEGLPPGAYDLRAAKNGGVAVYGANTTRETGETITLGDGETRANLKLRFLHYASISGHVFDSEGEPVIGAQVQLLRATRNFGRRMLVNGGPQAQTDDRGEYRMPSIQPGQYYLSAAPGFAPSPLVGTDTASAPKMMMPQFYGGARDSKDAALIAIKENDVMRGVDFRLVSESAIRIHGSVSGVPEHPAPENPPESAGRFRAGRRADQLFVQINISDVSTEPRSSMGFSAAPPDYTFTTGWLAPGEYRIGATVEVDGKTYYATQTVDARNGAADITLALAPAGDLKGRLQVDGKLDQKTAFTINLSQNGAGPMAYGFGRTAAQAGEDGRFTLARIGPGEWNLDVTPMPRGAFLKSVRYGDQEVRFSPFEIKSDSDASIEIVVSMHAAKIHGEVDAGSGDPARAAILLAPVGPYHDLARFYYGILADDHGKFRMIGIAPGKYKVYAVEKMAVAGFRTPEASDQVIALFADFVQEIDLAEDADLEIHPKLIPMERAREILP